MMVAKTAQLEMEMGEPIADPELLRLLDSREDLKQAASSYRRVAKEVNQRAEGHLLDGRMHECGRYVLKGTRIPEGHRDFDVKAQFRISIRKRKNGRRK